MSTRTIYNKLIAAGLTRAGALSVMGNMAAESGMKSNIAQRGTTKLSDEQYTAAADNGLIDFAHDGVGYGLYQLTYHKRKANYLSFCKARGVSVGDEDAQVEFCIKELREDFPTLFKTLCTSDDIDRCSDLVCSQFERPAVNNFDTRRAFAHQFDAEISEQPIAPQPVASRVDFTVAVIQFLMQFNDQSIWPYEIDGIKSKKFFDALSEFTDAMEGC